MNTEANIIPRPLAVDVVRVDVDAAEADVQNALMFLGRLKELTKEADAAITGDVTLWIKAHGPVRIGEMLYYVGPEKKPPKVLDLPAAVEALLMQVGGDFAAFCEHLASGALKYGAFKVTMGDEEFAKHFAVEVVDKLNAEPAEAAEKKLRKLNLAFVK